MAHRYRVLAARAAKIRRRAAAPALPPLPARSASRGLAPAAASRGLGVSTGDIEVALLDAAAKLHGEQPSLSDMIGDVFSSASMVRKLLGRCQDVLAERFDCYVGLASISEAEAGSWTGHDYGELVAWIAEQVAAG